MCLDTRGNFLCSSGLSFLGCAAHPGVSCSTNIQTCQPACQDEKEVFKQNFNCSMTPVELSHCVQGLFSDVYSALSESLTALEFSNRTNPCHFQRWHWKSFPLPVCPHYLLFNCPHTGRTGQTQGSYQDPPSINDFHQAGCARFNQQPKHRRRHVGAVAGRSQPKGCCVIRKRWKIIS